MASEKVEPLKRVSLFIIKARGRNIYWNESAEHGTGWSTVYPKQSFSKSELSSQLFRLIERGQFMDCEILELYCREPKESSDER